MILLLAKKKEVMRNLIDSLYMMTGGQLVKALTGLSSPPPYT